MLRGILSEAVIRESVDEAAGAGKVAVQTFWQL